MREGGMFRQSHACVASSGKSSPNADRDWKDLGVETGTEVPSPQLSNPHSQPWLRGMLSGTGQHSSDLV